MKKTRSGEDWRFLFDGFVLNKMGSVKARRKQKEEEEIRARVRVSTRAR